MENFFGAVLQGMLLGGIYALVALGVLIVYKSCKVFNMAHGDVMMLVAYMAWWLAVVIGLPLAIAIMFAILSGSLTGWVLNRFLLRPLIGKPMLITFLLTLLIGIAVRGTSLIAWKGLPQVFPSLVASGNVNIGGVTLPYINLVCFGIAMAMFILFVLVFRFTKIGFGMRSVSEDPDLSRALGIDIEKIYAVSWMIGGIVAGAGGILIAAIYAVDTGLGMTGMIKALPVLLLGGLESLAGCIVGALILGIVEMLASTYVDVMGFKEVLPFILIITILMFRPQGLFGLKRIERI